MRPVLLATAGLLALALAAVVLVFLWLTPAPVPPSDTEPVVHGQREPAQVSPLRVAASDLPQEVRAEVLQDEPTDATQTPSEDHAWVGIAARFVDPRGAILPGVQVRLEDRYGSRSAAESIRARFSGGGGVGRLSTIGVFVSPG